MSPSENFAAFLQEQELVQNSGSAEGSAHVAYADLGLHPYATGPEVEKAIERNAGAQIKDLFAAHPHPAISKWGYHVRVEMQSGAVVYLLVGVPRD